MAAQTVGAAAKPYNVVVWGATGFTGRLVCEHIVRNYQGKINWAIAGRNPERLAQVKKDLCKIKPECEGVSTIIADGDDLGSVTSMVQQTDVVISTAGPFFKYSNHVVEASARHGTHYCDITGETTWVKSCQKAYDDLAKQSGAKLVFSCGFDSLPSDLGALFVTDLVRSSYDKGTAQVYALVASMGAASGGTIATGLELATTKEMGVCARDKYYLVTDPSKHGSDRPEPMFPVWNSIARTYQTPWVMEVANSRVVHLSNALRPQPYGRDFKYSESLDIKYGAAAWGTTAAMALGAALLFSPLQPLLRRWLPKPGEGPSRHTMETGWWKLDLWGMAEAEAGQQPQVAHATVKHNADPGYLSTSRMVLEAGLCLALQSAQLREAGLPQAGVLTPATAMGTVLINRLQEAGFTFEAHTPAI